MKRITIIVAVLFLLSLAGLWVFVRTMKAEFSRRTISADSLALSGDPNLSSKILNYKNHPQETPETCGVAAVRMVAEYVLENEYTEEAVRSVINSVDVLNPEQFNLGKSVTPLGVIRGMNHYLEKSGYKASFVTFKDFDQELQVIRHTISNNMPVVVVVASPGRSLPHWVTIVGFDFEKRHLMVVNAEENLVKESEFFGDPYTVWSFEKYQKMRDENMFISDGQPIMAVAITLNKYLRTYESSLIGVLPTSGDSGDSLK